MKITLNKLNILGIKAEKIKKIPWILASHAFLVILFFILFNLILGVFLFYKYVILAETKEQKIARETVKLEYNIYQEVLKEWQKKEQQFGESPDKKYLNPFNVIP